MYTPKEWLDEQRDQHGNVTREGTLFDQNNMRHIEYGVFESEERNSSILVSLLQAKRDIDGVKGLEVSKTLTNTQSYPFNNSKATVSLPALRNNNGYYVIVEATSVTGGEVGEFIVSDKLLNGFKLEFTGSASSVTARCIVVGGM